MGPLVSIIVPVYKTKAYLERCVKSVLNQTYTDWELLLVDDGSPDESGELCDILAQQNTQIKVFHKKNGGVSSARNLGIKESKGTWIMFLDSDDFFNDINYIKTLVTNSKNADLVISGFSYYSETNGYKPKSITDETTYFSDQTYKDYMSLCLNRFDFLVVWAKLFKKQIIQDYHIQFNENMVVTEDALFLYQYLLHNRSLCVSNTKGYSFFLKQGKPQYKLSASQVAFHMNTIMCNLKALQDQCNISNQVFYEYIPAYFLRLYTKYIWANKLWFKEDCKEIKRIIKNPAVKVALQKNIFIRMFYHLFPLRLQLLLLDFQVRYKFRFKPSIY